MKRFLSVGFVLMMVAMGLCVSTPRVHAADEEKPQAEMTPEQVTLAFWEHLRAGEIPEAKELLFTPINNPRVKADIDNLLKMISEQTKESPGLHTFGAREKQDIALVIFGAEGHYRYGIDIDPMFLRKQDGQWKIVLANSEEDLRKELPTEEQGKIIDELIQWYGQSKEKVLTQWRAQKSIREEKS